MCVCVSSPTRNINRRPIEIYIIKPRTFYSPLCSNLFQCHVIKILKLSSFLFLLTLFCMREYFMSSDTSRHSLPMYEKPISRKKNFKLLNYFENVFQKIETTTHFPFYFFKSAIFTALFFFSCCVYSTHIYRLACVFHLASRTAGPFFNGRRLDPAAAVWWEIPRLPGE